MEFQTLSYYKYINLPDAPQMAADHLAFCVQLGVKGRVFFADEGLSGTVSGSVEQCNAYKQQLNSLPPFADLEFKTDPSQTHSFNKIHVRYRPEVVHFGHNIRLNPAQETAKHLSPQAVLQLKDQPNVVFLDARNKFEWIVGKFKNAVTLDIDTFRDFPEKLAELEPLKQKTVIAYCTGGIRCEKATAFLLQNGFSRDKLFQIDGGIINYAAQTGGTDFDGKCYVFDKRVVIDVNTVNPTVVSTCATCGSLESRMVNCANPECNNHYVQCKTCSDT